MSIAASVLIVLVSSLGSPQSHDLSSGDLEKAFEIPLGEELKSISARGENPGVIVFPREFSSGQCREAIGMKTCSFRVRWRGNRWQKKTGAFTQRADGIWIADKASQMALYSK